MDNIDFFNKHGYVFVENALSEDACKLAELYAFMEEQRAVFNKIKPFDDPQVHGSFSRYADPLMESILVKLRRKIEENTGLELVPSYSYYRVYRNGAKLDRHKDRGSCEISASLCLGYTTVFKWPLSIFDESCYCQKDFLMNPGDMVIYRGMEIEHWRETLDCLPKDYHVQSFLHYVDSSGDYKDLMFDGRESLFEIRDSNG